MESRDKLPGQKYDDEISLKELVLSVIKHWKTVVAVTVISAILGGVYAFFIAAPTYESEIEGTILIPEQTESKYGIFSFFSTDPVNYISDVKSEDVLERAIEELGLDTTADKLAEQVRTSVNSNTGYVLIRGRAGTAQDAVTLTETLARCFVEELNLDYKEKALDHFINFHDSNLRINEEKILVLENDLVSTQALLDATDKTVTVSRSYEGETGTEEVINPAYTTIENEIILIKLQISDFNLLSERSEYLLTELEEEKVAVTAYRISGDGSGITPGLLDVIKPYVKMDDEAIMPDGAIAPRKAFIVAVAAVLGLLAGVVFAAMKK